MQLAMTTDGHLTAQPIRRSVTLQQITQADRYRALRAYGVAASVAAAVASGLITITVKGA